MKGWISRIGFGAAATAVVVLAGGTISAGAASAGPAISAAGAAPAISAANDTSTAQAGYFVGFTAAPASATAKASFKVPVLTCTSTTSGIALGALVFTGAGATASLTAAEVFAVCSGGTAAYAAVTVVNGHQVAATAWAPNPGDTISVSVLEAATAGKAVVKDATQKRSFSQSKTTAGAPIAFVGIGIDALFSGTQLPVPQFATFKFFAGSLDGVTVHAAGAVPVNMQTSPGNVLQIFTGKLNMTGNTWSELFKHS
jgi:hypothetical protein